MSPRRPSHADFEELAVGYSLHALEPEDELRFAGHLASCALCQQALAEHAGTLGVLAGAVPQLDPPPALLNGIRSAVAREPARPRTAQQASPVDELAVHRRRRDVPVRRSWLLTAAAAVTAVVVGLGAWNAALRNDRNSVSARGDRLAAAVKALERPGTRTVRLAGFDGHVRAVAVAQGASVQLVVDGLAPNDARSVYVLWGQTRSGVVRAVSAFDVPHAGTDVLSGVTLAVPMDQLTQLMVTHEDGRVPPVQAQHPVLAAGTV